MPWFHRNPLSPNRHPNGRQIYSSPGKDAAKMPASPEQPSTINPKSGPPEAEKTVRKVTPRSIRGRIVAGLLLIIPLAVTFWLVSFVYAAALWVGAHLVTWIGWAAVAVVLTVLSLYLLGWIGTNAVGVRIISLFEWLLERIPFVETLYVAVKRIVQALTGANRAGGNQQRVVLVDFPHENMKTLAFLTNIITDAASGQRYATVYVPTTPNPTSGYMELVPVDKVTPTDLTMEAGLSMILSAGASSPPTIHLYERGKIGDPKGP
jgi:uncharacterized membrane protein